MFRECKKTCNFCNKCKDLGSDCRKMRSYCNTTVSPSLTLTSAILPYSAPSPIRRSHELAVPQDVQARLWEEAEEEEKEKGAQTPIS